MQTTTLSIGGMTCAGCAKSVTRVLSNLQGVASVDVSVDQAHAVITYDPAKVKHEDLGFVVKAAGFTVT